MAAKKQETEEEINIQTYELLRILAMSQNCQRVYYLTMISIELVLSANNLKPTEQQKSLKQNWKKKKIKNDTKKKWHSCLMSKDSHDSQNELINFHYSIKICIIQHPTPNWFTKPNWRILLPLPFLLDPIPALLYVLLHL